MKQFYFLIALAIAANTKAQFFTKITNGPLVNTIGDSRSVNWIDVNNDGWVDCFISNGPPAGQNNMLYLNNNGTGFTAVSGDPIVQDGKPSDGATFGDVDNDGDMDAYVTNWYGQNKMLYLNNGSGSFVKIDTGSIVNDGGFSETASWGDHDKDGLLDVYVTNSANGNLNFMYHNNGGNNFSKVITGSPVTDAYLSRSVNWTDIDGDNDLDIFVTNESNQNENIYRNDGAGTFSALTSGALIVDAGQTMSSSWGDIDNDGDQDVFLANDQGYNSLFRNNGGFNFLKILNDTVTKTPSRSFSSAWSDVDNDGDLDLFVTNSFGPAVKRLNFFYLNNGDGTFVRNGTDIIASDSAWSYGCAFADYDNDGFEDLAVATCRFGGIDRPDFLYHNNGNSNKWIGIKLVGTVSNRSAIGTKIRVKATINGNPVWQMREISAQSSYCGQNDMRAHFGLGNATGIDSVKIEWPLGMVEYYKNINVDQIIQYVEGATVSLKENEGALANLKIYPNPAKGVLNVECEMLNGISELQLFDSNGKMVLNERVDKKHSAINVKDLKAGIYLMVLRSGSYSVSRKIVIEN